MSRGQERLARNFLPPLRNAARSLSRSPWGEKEPGARARPAKAHIWWLEARFKHGNLLKGRQDAGGPTAHMAASPSEPPVARRARVLSFGNRE